MTSLQPVLVLTLFVTLTATAGSEHLVKQRAKDIRDQQNERQGVPAQAPTPPTQPAAPAQPTQSYAVQPYAAQPNTPALSQQATGIARALGALQKADAATEEQVQELSQSLTAAARGSTRPSASKINKLARDLSDALPGTNLSAAQASRLARQLESALNDSFGAKEMETLATHIHDALRDTGVGKVDAKVVSNDVRSIIAENQRGGSN